MYWYIYLTTNLITGQKYIGMHKYSEKKLDPDYIGSGKHLWNSINYHGYDKYKDFKCEILEFCDSEQEASIRERYYTDLYNAVDDPNFYNISPGGHGGFDYINKNNLCPTRTGNPKDHPLYGRRGKDAVFYGRNHTAEAKAKMSEFQKDMVQINNGVEVRRIKKYAPLPDGWEYGELPNENKKWTEERKEHQAEVISGKITINNGEITKRVLIEELDLYTNSGWELGYRDSQNIKGKRENLPENYNSHLKGSKWITNGIENHRYKGDKLYDYINNKGFWLGYTKLSK